jgi:hypothetical protein
MTAHDFHLQRALGHMGAVEIAAARFAWPEYLRDYDKPAVGDNILAYAVASADTLTRYGSGLDTEFGDCSEPNHNPLCLACENPDVAIMPDWWRPDQRFAFHLVHDDGSTRFASIDAKAAERLCREANGGADFAMDAEGGCWSVERVTADIDSGDLLAVDRLPEAQRIARPVSLVAAL